MATTGVDHSAPATDVGGRARILREARKLFTAQGFAVVSMQQIADAAAINKATLYHHFRDKEDLFISVMVEEFARMAAGLSAVIAEGGSLRHQLQRIASHIFAAQHSDFGRLSADLRAHVSNERRSSLFDRCTPPWEQIRAVIDEAIRAGEARDVDADLVARAFFAMVGSQIWWSTMGTGRPDPDDAMAMTLTDLLLNGIANDRTARQPEVDDALEPPRSSHAERLSSAGNLHG